MFRLTKPHLFLIGFLLGVFCEGLSGYSPHAWAASAQSVLASQAFEKRYQAYFERTANRPVSQLNAYLDSAVENVFLDTSQVAATALTAEVRYFNQTLFESLQMQLCQDGAAFVPPEDELQLIIVRSTAAAAKASAIRVSSGDHGRIAGIVANIIQQTQSHGFCRRRSFSDLE